MAVSNLPHQGTGARGPAPAPVKITVGDVWYALFRHKGKVMLLALLGVAGAAVLYLRNPPPYISEAKLLVRYVVEARSVEALSPDGSVKTPPSTGANIINSEAEILNSLDLCRQVAEAIGPERILPRGRDGGSNVIAAADLLFKGLTVDVPKNSNVIKVSMTHPDPEIAQTALQRLIELYFKRHVEVHRGLGSVDELLAQQTDQVRSRLVQSDEELRNLRTKAGVLSLEDTKRSYTEQMGNIRQMLLTAEAELAEYRAFTKAPGTNVAATTNTTSTSKTSTNAVGIAAAEAPAATNALASPSAAVAITNGLATNPTASPARLAEYRAVLSQLESLHREEMQLRSIYTDENRSLARVREQLADAEATRKAIEEENPAFTAPLQPWAAAPASSGVPAPALLSQALDPNRPRALEARIEVLTAQYNKLREEAAALEEFETSLTQLQRKRELDEKNYRHFSAGLEQARFDEALGSGKLANISVVQSPSPPKLNASKRLKISGLALAAGLFGGVGLALLIELMLDPSVRRPGHIETTLSLPLMLTIPNVRLGKAHRAIAASSALEKTKTDGPGLSIDSWSHGHPLRQHIEALRDRTLMHFEGFTHKPKLIGITGCRDGAGVTTIACALAAALSETGEGGVLLINLNAASQSRHPFLPGQQACSLVDVVQAGKRESALIGNNLYIASGSTSGANGSALLPTSIARLLPTIKTSDYDYVICDLPCVNRTSITSKLAGMVDLVFVVAESEKDSQESIKRACEQLKENNAIFKIVLNKFHSYVPRWLYQEI